jgi:hypothetical protein
MLLTFLGGRARGIEGPKISTAKSPPQFGPLDADVVTPVIVPLPLGGRACPRGSILLQYLAATLLYTSNRGGTISINLNGEPATSSLTIPSTYNAADPVAWRQ